MDDHDQKKTTTGEPCDSGPPREQITEWTARIEMHQSEPLEKTTNQSRASCFIRSRMTSQPHRLKKTSNMQSKRRDLHHTWLHLEANKKLSFYRSFVFPCPRCCRHRGLLKVFNINVKSPKFAWSKESPTANYLSFYLELNAALIRYAEVNTSSHSWNSNYKYIFIFKSTSSSALPSKLPKFPIKSCWPCSFIW